MLEITGIWSLSGYQGCNLSGSFSAACWGKLYCSFACAVVYALCMCCASSLVSAACYLMFVNIGIQFYYVMEYTFVPAHFLVSI